ncbi:MAG: hypothetical protein M1823_000544 [Watsoniomyces obsoletus]|nr:MAG: hypothetical protein M1823_000544 [Watsoniomyces obsoletus]
MAGQRLLDLAALVNASRPVFKQHIDLRRRQLDVYSRTSSLCKAVKRQTDSFVQTAQATAYFSQRLGGFPSTGPSSSGGSRRGYSSSARPSRSSVEKRQLQRQAESQIPSTAAGQASDDTPLSKNHDQDVFYTRTEHVEPVLSELPRAKIPKHTDNTQGGRGDVDGRLNADVFHSSGGRKETESVPKVETVSEQEHIPEDINTDVFHSPKVAQLLGNTKDAKGELGMKAASGTPVEQTGMNQHKDQDTFNIRLSQQEKTTKPEMKISDTKTSSEEMRKLGAEMAGSSNANMIEQSSPYQMHESKVPSSRFSRLWHYGGLATGMALGAVGESVRRVTGNPSDTSGSLMMSASNMDRLVSTLSRMRGAALKLGQMVSFQDSSMLPPALQEVLQRVQDKADYMPIYQRDEVLSRNLGSNWRDLFSSFNDIPMAAASIGQVHSAILRSTGEKVAVKVQYPGVADSIDSDLNNLSILLTASRLLPKGLYLEKTIANARVELAWECDYMREARCAKRFQGLIKGDEAFRVPRIIEEGSHKEVLTMEYMDGVVVTKVLGGLSRYEKNWIGTQILKLCLKELVEWRFMQTDPNWTNFLYRRSERSEDSFERSEDVLEHSEDKLGDERVGMKKEIPPPGTIQLLDFGASREYPPSFIEPYTSLLEAGVSKDSEKALELSIQLGYLTGYESPKMRQAHLESLFILAEPFRGGNTTEPSSTEKEDEGDKEKDVYDFSNQSITSRIRGLIGVMLQERLTPPPEETYSLHRKLSGAFLLLAKLGARVDCKRIWNDVVVNNRREGR